MSGMIRVFYSCPPCGLLKVGVDIAARTDGEDIVGWMDKVKVALSQDHAQRSPCCMPKQLKDVMIPMAGAKHIGSEAEN